MSKDNAPLVDNFKGSILGAAVGDALGAGYEFTTPSENQIIKMIGGGVFDWKPGEWTDDTQMSLAVLAALADGESSTDSIAKNFLDWFESSPPDVGNQTRSVLSSTEKPDEMLAVAAAFYDANPKAAGNGALMRTSPVSLITLKDRDRVADFASEVASLTHPHKDSVNACILWSLAITNAVNSVEEASVFDWIGVVREGLDYIETNDRDRWARVIDDAEAEDPKTFTPNGWVVSAFQAALSAISHTLIPTKNPHEHFEKALINAVRIGDDTDTVASIAGAYLGAKWGKEAIPNEWLKLLNGYRILDSEVLTALEIEGLVESAFLLLQPSE